MSDVDYRRVVPSEAAEVARSLARLHADAHASNMALGLLAPLAADLAETYRELVERLDARERVLVVAERRGELVGMAQLALAGAQNAAHRAEVQRVTVASATRGHGIGSGLMRAIDAEARAAGVTLLWLTTHDGSPACSFYESLGYTKLGVMPAYSRRPDGTLADGAFYYRTL